MTKYEDLENRIIMIEKEINCRNLENKLNRTKNKLIKKFTVKF